MLVPLVNLAETLAAIVLAVLVVRVLARRGRAGLFIGAALWALSLLPSVWLANYGFQCVIQSGDALDLLPPFEGALMIVDSIVPSCALLVLVALRARTRRESRPAGRRSR